MKLTEIGAPPGVRDLNTLLHFLNNQEAYEERLKKMELLREQLNSKLVGINSLNDVERARTVAASDRRKAAMELTQAKDKADKIMAEVNAAVEENKQRSEALDERERQIVQGEQRLANIERKVDAEAAKVDNDRRALVQKTREQRDANAKTLADLKGRAEKLKEVAAEVA